MSYPAAVPYDLGEAEGRQKRERLRYGTEVEVAR